MTIFKHVCEGLVLIFGLRLVWWNDNELWTFEWIYLFIYLLNLSTTQEGRQDKSVGTWKFGTWGGGGGGCDYLFWERGLIHTCWVTSGARLS